MSKGGIIIDPTKNTKYPVILSDALMGMPSNETFTGVRCEPVMLGKPQQSGRKC